MGLLGGEVRQLILIALTGTPVRIHLRSAGVALKNEVLYWGVWVFTIPGKSRSRWFCALWLMPA